MLRRPIEFAQYASGDFQALLDEHGIECSMSGTGSCYDNAAMESWFGLLKRERVNRRRYPTRKDARLDVFDYIERFYNRRRPHGSAGRMSPMQYEAAALNQPVSLNPGKTNVVEPESARTSTLSHRRA